MSFTPVDSCSKVMVAVLVSYTCSIVIFLASDKSLEYSDYVSDDDHSVTTGSAFINRFIPEICSVHFVFLETQNQVSGVSL